MQVDGGPAQRDLGVGQAAHGDHGARDVGSGHAGVADHDTSQASRFFCCSRRAAKCGDPDSSSPSIRSFTVTAGVSRPVAARCARIPSRWKATLPLSSIAPRACSSGPWSGPRRGWARTAGAPTARAGRPAARRGARTRAQSARPGRRWATRRTPRAPRRSARSRRSGSRCGAAPRPARRRWPRRPSACAGSAEIDGIRSQASRSACRSSRWAVTYSRSGLLVTVADRSAARSTGGRPASVRHMSSELLRVDVGDLTFDVRATGPDDGRPVLLLHGFPQTSLSWAAVTPLLAEAGLRMLRARPARLLPRRAPTGRRRLRPAERWRR